MVLFYQYDDLATLEVLFSPRLRLGEYCTLRAYHRIDLKDSNNCSILYRWESYFCSKGRKISLRKVKYYIIYNNNNIYFEHKSKKLF